MFAFVAAVALLLAGIYMFVWWPDSRWHMITESWALMLAAALGWLLFEPLSEHFASRRQLRELTKGNFAIVESVAAYVAAIINDALPVEPQAVKYLMYPGPYRENRRKGLAAARAALEAAVTSQSAADTEPNVAAMARGSAKDLNRLTQQLSDFIARESWLLWRLPPEINNQLSQFRRLCDDYLTFVNEYVRENDPQRSKLGQAVSRQLHAMCEVGIDLYSNLVELLDKVGHLTDQADPEDEDIFGQTPQ